MGRHPQTGAVTYVPAGETYFGPASLSRPGAWSRAGDALPDYTFRGPTDDDLLCIGARAKPRGAVQCQRNLLPGKYRCKVVRFTAFAAGRKSEALFWINAGEKAAVTTRFAGDCRWKPLKLEHASFVPNAGWLGFGVVVRGGDLWLYRPRLEIVPAAGLLPSVQDRIAACRKQLDRLSRQVPEAFPDNDR